MVITEEEFLAELRAHVAKKYITRSAAADAWGLSRSYASAVVAGTKPPSQQILDDIGYERTKTVGYQKQG